jgi:hypothetical protein
MEKFVLLDSVTWKEEKQGELKTVFKNWEIDKRIYLNEIRQRLLKNREIVEQKKRLPKQG